MRSRRIAALLLLGIFALLGLAGCSLPKGESQQPAKTIDEGITEDPAGYYFDFAIANRLDFVPEFNEGEAPTSSAPYLWYAFMLQEEKPQNQEITMTKEYVEQTIKDHFEVKEVTHESQEGEWTFDGELYHPAPTSYAYEPIYGLKELSTYTKDGVTIYNLLMEQYIFDEFAWESPSQYQPAEDNSNVSSHAMEYVLRKKGMQIEKGELTVLEAIRQMISEGDVGEFQAKDEEWFQYYVDSETGNVVFIEHTYLQQ